MYTMGVLNLRALCVASGIIINYVGKQPLALFRLATGYLPMFFPGLVLRVCETSFALIRRISLALRMHTLYSKHVLEYYLCVSQKA